MSISRQRAKLDVNFASVYSDMSSTENAKWATLCRRLRQGRRLSGIACALIEGYWLALRHGALRTPNQPQHTVLVRQFCRRVYQALGIDLRIHGQVPQTHALWVSNHISWIDIAVIGSQTRVFFLSKAEVADWPIMGKLAQAGGTLFIKRGSGDAERVRDQIAQFLRDGMSILFFPEGTTTNGTRLGRIHGRLLGAAIDANVPVQPVVLCYISNGQLDQTVPYINDINFKDNLLAVTGQKRIAAHVLPLEPIPTEGHTVETLTTAVRERMTLGLQRLQRVALLTPA